MGDLIRNYYGVTITDFLWDLQVLIFRDFLQSFF